MNKQVVILIADDDEGHQLLVRRNLRKAGIGNKFLFFSDGQEILDYLFKNHDEPNVKNGESYLLLLDIRMPKVSGIEVLEQVKKDPKLKRIPVIMLTTTDDPREINRCHQLGCNFYITKPIEYTDFIDKIRNMGLYLTIVEMPRIEE
ncbi:MAG TPA: response regulator [Caldisericia bacterium]|nr:response regulator [Caldisericia bacterium]HPF48358.1 response regulator [Caldisericia bacterium]HPI83463.1 response regulator [Caldisericia bacterium]HPQ92811.1 response regulator [Caldisericia bacterium]HRV74091.1 response regulator [Caldisericia bacterium]